MFPSVASFSLGGVFPVSLFPPGIIARLCKCEKKREDKNISWASLSPVYTARAQIKVTLLTKKGGYLRATALPYKKTFQEKGHVCLNTIARKWTIFPYSARKNTSSPFYPGELGPIFARANSICTSSATPHHIFLTYMWGKHGLPSFLSSPFSFFLFGPPLTNCYW